MYVAANDGEMESCRGALLPSHKVACETPRAFDHTGLTLSWSEGAGVKRSRFLEPLLAGGASAGSAAAGGAAASGAAARGAVAVPSTAAPRCAFTTAAAACATPFASVTNGQLAAAPRCAPAATAPAPASVAQAAPNQTSSHLAGLPDDFFSWD